MKKPDFFSRVEQADDKVVHRRTFLSFLGFAAAGVSGFFGWKWLNRQPLDQGALQPLRSTLETNEKILTSTFSEHHLVKTYPVEKAVKEARVNSLVGLPQSIDAAAWRLHVKKLDGSDMAFTFNQLRVMPKKEIVYEFKCVEGWSQVQHWAGVPLKDFIEKAGLADQTKAKYIGMQTPNGQYYVGLDMQSALHPQTLLAYEMSGKPLSMPHGFPLRLIVPVKYGIKNLKCIGSIFFTDVKPRDYWAERGYDYYSGL